MAAPHRTPPAASPSPPLPAMDYEQALTVARQFVHFFRAARHLEELVEALAHHEQRAQEIEARILRLQTQEQEHTLALQSIQEIMAKAKATYQEESVAHKAELALLAAEVARAEEAQATLLKINAEIKQRGAEMDELQQVQARRFAEEAAQATQDLLAHRQGQLDKIAEAHRLQVAELEEQARQAQVTVTTFEQQLQSLRAQAAQQLGLTEINKDS